MDPGLVQTLSNLKDHVRIATKTDRVHKDQCFYSFDTPKSPDGLYVSLFSFFSYGREFVVDYFKKSGKRLFLNVKCETIVEKTSESESKEKPTKFGIGIEGGFSLPGDTLKTVNAYNLVLLPEFISIPLSSDIPSPIYESLLSIKDMDSASDFDQFSSWENVLVNSKHSDTLIQLENNVKIPPSGWKCEKCDLTSNLWLNLTDGSILCGRRQFDGSGGNNHAMEHYTATKYPLSVKLGTITPEGGDVFSYDEDDMVLDTNLSNHLAHFGINVALMHKTEKTMGELQIDLNILTWEGSTIQELGSVLVRLYGPGFIGLNNLGNSCYLNSVFQVLFSIPQFIEHYFEKVELHSLFDSTDITKNLDIQLKKLANGLLSKRYFRDPSLFTAELPKSDSYNYNSISPIHLRSAFGFRHSEFSSTRQQDAQEYLLHVLNKVDTNLKFSGNNPCTIFRFQLEERLECLQTHSTQYSTRDEFILSLTIPKDPIFQHFENDVPNTDTNETEQKSSESDPRSKPSRSYLKVGIDDCFKIFESPQLITGFTSSVTKAVGSVSKTTRFKTFPRYLFIHFAKFAVGEDWIPKKLDVEINGINDILDIESLRAPKRTEEASQQISGNKNPELFANLKELGFPEELCSKAVNNADNLEGALIWCTAAIESGSQQDVLPGHISEANVAPLMEFGFTREQCIFALEKTSNSVDRAADYLFSHLDEISALMESKNAPKVENDGIGKYKIIAIISHIGSSTMSGHYVSHIFKGDKWVLFNDETVSESKNPPFKLGYIYLYQRM